jgi:bifunctional non-homologous end joining protein LigD
MVTWKLKVSTFVPPAEPSIRFNEHLDEEDGPLVFEHACKLGLEGIVSKRKDHATGPAARRTGLRARTRTRRAVKREPMLG